MRSEQLAYPIVSSTRTPRPASSRLRQAFDAEVLMAHEDDDGRVRPLRAAASRRAIVMRLAAAAQASWRARAEWSSAERPSYLIVSDPDTHHRRATEAGAEVVDPLARTRTMDRAATQPWTRRATCRSFGTYRPVVP